MTGGLSYLTDGDQVLLDGDGEPLVEHLPPPAAPTRIDSMRPIAGQPPVAPTQPAGDTVRIADALSGGPKREGVG